MASLSPGALGAGVPEGGVFYIHGDHVGSSLLITDAGGGLRTRLAYDPYGNLVVLRRLSLQRTAVTDAVLPKLASLTQLQMLNLHTTGVSDSGIQALRPLTGLKRLYVWQTKVTPTGAANLRAAMPSIDIDLGD